MLGANAILVDPGTRAALAESKAEAFYVVIKDDALGLALEFDASCRFDSKLHGPRPAVLGSIWEARGAPFASTGPKLDSRTCGRFRSYFKILCYAPPKISTDAESAKLFNLKLAINSIDHRRIGRLSSAFECPHVATVTGACTSIA